MILDSAHETVSPSRRAVERAEAYLTGCQSTPIEVSELSRIVGISERSLRRAFQSVHGTSPKRYMLAERLRAVRRDLGNTSNQTASVTDVAQRYGFSELGRFAGYYRKAYGETPSDTLRRTRR